MTTMVIDRQTPMDTLFSFIGAERVMLSKEADRVVLTPTVDKETFVQKPTIDEIFDAHLFSFTGYRFDRDEANNYE